MKKAIIALAAVSLGMLPVTISACADAAESPGTPVAPDEAPSVSPLAAALGAALDHVAGLPESRDPVHYGSRTFEISGEVLVKVDAGVADAEIVIEDRGWALVTRSPRTCGDTWDLADSGGYPYCWLHDAPDALYLRVSSARSLDGGGFEVVVHPYRNVRLPEDYDLSMGLIQTGEFNSPTGRFEDHDFDGHAAELVRLVSATSSHPGVLSDGGMLRVRVAPDGTASHEGEFSGWFYSNPNGGDGHPRGIRRAGHIGPVNPPMTEADRRVEVAFDACMKFMWGSEDHKRCRREAHRISLAASAEEKARFRTAVEAARAIVGEVAK